LLKGLRTMASEDKRIAQSPPLVDEWGIYDPDQAGLAAVIQRLEARRLASPSPTDARAMLYSMREVSRFRTTD
jgi:hypothetical protein